VLADLFACADVFTDAFTGALTDVFAVVLTDVLTDEFTDVFTDLFGASTADALKDITGAAVIDIHCLESSRFVWMSGIFAANERLPSIEEDGVNDPFSSTGAWARKCDAAPA